MTKPYKDALAEARKVGAAHATGDAFLAQTCFALSAAYPVNPKMLYLGAAARELSARELVKLAHDDPGEFAFVPFDAPPMRGRGRRGATGGTRWSRG